MMICAVITILCIVAIVAIIVLKVAAKKALIMVIREANGRIISDDFKDGLKKHPFSQLRFKIRIRDTLTYAALSLMIIGIIAYIVGVTIAVSPYENLKKERKEMAETTIITQKADYEAIEDFNRRVDKMYANRTTFEKVFYLLDFQTKIEGKLYINVKEW